MGQLTEYTMKDTELRAVVLQKYYDLRDLGFFQWGEVKLEEQFPIKTFNVLGRICDQLGEHRLIDWRASKDGRGMTVGGAGKITAFGVDVIEGTAQPPISITFDHRQTVSITGSNNIVGDHNSMNADGIDLAISHSNFCAADKAEAKSVWKKACENKLLNTVVGSVFGAATKHAFETATHPK